MLKKLITLTLCVSLMAIGVFKAQAKERKGEVRFSVSVNAPESSRDVRVWLPYPVSGGVQTIDDINVEGNFTRQGVYREKETGNLILYAEWTKPARKREMTLTFKASATENIRKDFPVREPDIPVEARPYLKSSMFIPTDGRVRDIALKITEGRETIAEKARAVYDWVVENTHRDPNVKGCGTGEVEMILARRGGKCADISSVFVALARAAGVPAREVFGLRLGKKDQQDITKGHHCWAEFYVPGYGWVPTDPADVRKIMLVKKLDLKAAKSYRDYYFGAVGEYRISLTRGGRGYFLNPRQNGGPLNYFMYPYAEVDGKPLEWLAAQKKLKYSISFTADDVVAKK